MKLKIKFLIPLLVAVMAAPSCKRELLKASPTTQILEQEVFDTPERILGQVNGIYSAAKSGQYLGGRYIVYNEIRGDEFLNRLTNGVTGLQTWNHTLGTNTAEVVNLWNAVYFMINNCNLFLDGMTAKGDAVVGDALSKNYRGEARFMRALGYFHLLMMYARPYADANGTKDGLPIRLTGNKGPGPNDLKRATVAETYAQILADLDYAEQNLPLTYGANSPLNVLRAHRNTAIALKTRVYLHMGNWAKVIQEADKIVSAAAPFKAATGIAHELEPDIVTVFKSYTRPESILSMPFTANNLPGIQNSLAHYFTPANPEFASPAAGNAEYAIRLTGGIVADGSWGANDKRRQFIYDPPAPAPANDRYMVKYPTGPVQTDYLPVIRYAEILLNLAEALVRNTNTVDARAVALLNAVRQRSDPSVTFTVAGFATPQALIDAILKERRIELLGEGFRSPDLLRLLQPIPGKATVNTIQPTQSEYIWPISAQELLNNKLMTPNP